ncbi:hypothetical protein FRC03_005948 [Tulasnella sp. 419]|nr:hypothetical protein FRC03_005948 [Tulasnella sp. 419]
MAGDSMTSVAQRAFPLDCKRVSSAMLPSNDVNIQESASISYSAESTNGPKTQPTEVHGKLNKSVHQLNANSEQTGIADFGFGLAFVLIHLNISSNCKTLIWSFERTLLHIQNSIQLSFVGSAKRAAKG